VNDRLTGPGPVSDDIARNGDGAACGRAIRIQFHRVVLRADRVGRTRAGAIAGDSRVRKDGQTGRQQSHVRERHRRCQEGTGKTTDRKLPDKTHSIPRIFARHIAINDCVRVFCVDIRKRLHHQQPGSVNMRYSQL